MVPVEVLTLIVGHLLVPEGRARSGADVQLDDLRNARLVCRQWNAAASAHMFRVVALLHSRNGKGFPNFARLVASPTVRHAARCVEIYSGPHHYGHDMGTDRDYDVWDGWEDGNHDEFISAINSIARLPNLQAVSVRFSERCSGVPDNGDSGDMTMEETSTRTHTLVAVFKAVQARAARGAACEGDTDLTTITALALQNLQNKPIPDLIASEPFQSLAQNITDLRLLITEEHNEHGPDDDMNKPERRTFEPWLQKEFLPLFADRLTLLQLAFSEKWGAAPGYFDGKGLFFPHLKTLTLGDFIIGHHDQFDWVLAHKTIETLRLEHCQIVSHLSFMHSDDVDGESELRAWGTPTHGWTRYPEWSWGVDDRCATFHFSGTWEAVFDGIRAQLPNLVDFCMDNTCRKTHYWENSTFNSPEHIRCMLGHLRYITFDAGLCPSPWISADGRTGEMKFGNCDPAVPPPEERKYLDYEEKGILNRSQETWVGDRRAFLDLVRTVGERRRERGR